MKCKNSVYVVFSFLVLGFLLVAMKPTSNTQVQSSIRKRKISNLSPKTKSSKFRKNIGTGKKNSPSRYTKKTKRIQSKGVVTPKTKGRKAIGYKLNKQNKPGYKTAASSQHIISKNSEGDNLKVSSDSFKNEKQKKSTKKPKIKSYRIN